MAYGVPGQFDDNSSPFDVGTAHIREDLTMTLRSMRDSLSNSLQTLNLTMAGIHNQLRNMASVVTPRTGQFYQYGYGPTYIPSSPASPNLGAMSVPMAQNLANSSMVGLAFSSKPFNVGGYEWAAERNREMQSRMTQFGVDGGLGVANIGMSNFAAERIMGGYKAYRGLGMIGKTIASTPMALAFNMALSPITDTMADAAATYNRDISLVQRMSPKFGGERWSRRQASGVARNIGSSYYNELNNRTAFTTNLGMDGYREMMAQGLDLNMFQGSHPEELVKQMEKAAGVVKFLTGVLGSKDISETIQAVGQMKGMGINMFQNPAFAHQIGNTAFKYGQITGMSGGQMLGQAASAAGVFQQYGMPGFIGIQPALQTMALSNEMEKRRFLSPAQLAAAGGHEGILAQTMGFNAAMMNNPSVGKMMLAAGWQGGNNFSMGAMKGAFGGGYFGGMTAALGGIAGDVNAYAEFMVNQEDLMASAANQGNISDMMGSILEKAMQTMPMLKDENAAIMFVKNVANNMGSPISTATAKMIVMKQRHPNLMSAMDRRANIEQAKAYHAQNALESGPFRVFSRSREKLENAFDKAKYNLGRGGRDFVDAIGRWTSKYDTDEYMPYGDMSTGVLDGGSITAAQKFSKLDIGINTMDAISTDRFADAKRRVAMPNGTMDYIGTNGTLRLLKDIFDADPNVEAGIRSSMAANNGDYFKAAAGQSGIGKAEAAYNLKKYGITAGKVNKSVWFMNQDDPLGVLKEMAEVMSAGSADALAASSTGANWYKNTSKDRASEIAAAMGLHSNMSKNDVLDYLMANGNSNNAIGKYAASNGISMRQAAFGIANIYGTGDMSNFGKIYGAGNSDFADISKQSGAYAHAIGRSPMAEDLAAQAGVGTMSASAALGGLSKLGLTQDDIDSIIASGDVDSVKAFSEAMTLLGEGKADEADIGSIKNKRLKAIAENMIAGGTDRFIRTIGKDGVLGYGGVNKGVGVGSRINGSFAAVAKGSLNTNILKNLRDIQGFDISDEEFNSSLDAGNLYDLITSTTASTDEGKATLSSIRGIKGMSKAQKEDYLKKHGISLGAQNLDDAHMNEAITRSMIEGSSAKGMALDSSKGEKSSIDKAVTIVNGKHVVQTISYDDPAADAVKNLRDDKGKTITKSSRNDFFGVDTSWER